MMNLLMNLFPDRVPSPMRGMPRFLKWAIPALCVFWGCLGADTEIASLRADVLTLKDGGTVEGKFLNPQEVPRAVFEMQTESGIIVSVPVQFAERSPRRLRDVEVEYEQFAPLREDTIENHRELAVWCTDRQLTDQKNAHWNRILQLDPENAEAHQRLGHQKIDGLWTTREEQNIARGYIRYDGSWKTQQEIDIQEQSKQAKAAALQWKRQLDQMRASLAGNMAARERIAAIDDPYAIAPLVEKLSQDNSADARILYIKALSNIDTPAAVMQIAGWAIGGKEKVPDVLEVCYAEIRKHPESIPLVGRNYASYLDPSRSDNALINRAAYGIGKIGARSMVPELIEALVTTHKWKRTVQNQGNVGRGNGVSGLAWGNTEITGADTLENPEVRRALNELTGQDFGYDKAGWKQWLIQIRKTPTFDARRG